MQVDSIHDLGEQIGTRLARAEALGAEGMVDESLKLMEEVEELKKKKSAAEVINSIYIAISNQIRISYIFGTIANHFVNVASQ